MFPFQYKIRWNWVNCFVAHFPVGHQCDCSHSYIAFNLCMSLSLNFLSCPITFNLDSSLKNNNKKLINRFRLFFFKHCCASTYNRHNCWLFVFRECIRLIMHHAVIIICGIEVCHFLVGILIEIAFRPFLNIFPMNCDIIISVVSTLHVIETKRCTKNIIKKRKLQNMF